MYTESTTHTQYLELSITTMVFWFKVENDWLSEESHTTPYYSSINKHSMKFYYRLDLRDMVFVKKRTLMVFPGLVKV